MDLFGLLNFIISAASALIQGTAGILGFIFSGTVGRVIELLLGKSTEQVLQNVFVFSAMKMPVKIAALDYIRSHCKKIRIPTTRDLINYIRNRLDKRR